MVEAAILIPCLVLILYWATALTDVLVLKLKAAEALRYAMWETTVFKDPSRIDAEVQRKFADLRSPRILEVAHTGLSLYPSASDLGWRAAVDSTSSRVSLGGTIRLPPGTAAWDRFVNVIVGTLSQGVDTAVERQRFNVHGKSVTRVALGRARHGGRSPILQGGDLLGLRGGHDLAVPGSLANFTLMAPLASERPMELVFDTWKAWPKPALYTLDGAATEVGVSPARTYPVVEAQVASQVGQIAFFGLDRHPWFNNLRDVAGSIGRAGATQALLGGQLPDIFSSDRMDGPKRGPISILPVERADASWVPDLCDVRGSLERCATQRAGDVRTDTTTPTLLDDLATLGPGIDRTRYTVPFRINGDYWRTSGGTDEDASSRRTTAVKTQLRSDNESVRTYHCRGHYFAGSQKPEEPNPANRYARSCGR